MKKQINTTPIKGYAGNVRQAAQAQTPTAGTGGHSVAYYRQTQRAVSSGREWSTAEINRIWDSTISDEDLARELGRSVQAIHQARYRYANQAPRNWQRKQRSI